MVDSFASLRAKYARASTSGSLSLGTRMRRMAERMLLQIEVAWCESDGDWDAQEKLIQLYIKLSAAIQKIPVEKESTEELVRNSSTPNEDKAIIEQYIARLKEKNSATTLLTNSVPDVRQKL